MRSTDTVRALLLAGALTGAFGCTSGPDTKQDASATPECASPQVQRVLTYCVSPQAAQTAKANAQLRQDLASLGDQINPKVFPLPLGSSATLGPADASVTFVVFSDLECPYCAQAHAELEALQQLYPQDVRIVFKHFPLSFHDNAKPAARAAQAAGAQGKFWEFTAKAFERQEELGEALYLALAKELGLDVERFKADMASEQLTKQISEDMGLAKALYVQATPTIFLNGVALPGAVPADQLKPVIEQQRGIAQAFLNAGVPKDEIYWRMVRAQYQPLEKPPAPEIPENIVAYIPVSDSPAQGSAPEKTLVTITVFSDFECPYCQGAVGPLQAIAAKYPEQVRVVFKHFPLPFHERADEAAGLALLAHKQGKFWQAHDLLFEAQEDLSDEALIAIGKKLGLNEKTLLTQIKDPAFEELIRRDMTLGIKAGVEGTPTFYINGKQFVGIMQEDELEPEITAQLALANKLLGEGVKAGETLYEALVKANFDAEQAAQEAARKQAAQDEQ